jgi:predicted DNA-binding transcriptional regulator YafY
MKPASRPQYYRIKRIVDMVREGSKEGYLPNRGDFRRELEVSPRTLARDLDFLRDEERAPIEYDATRHGYRLTDETYRLPPVRISRKEAFGFALARRLLAAFEGTPLHLEMRTVLGKIAESMEGEISVEPEWLSEQVSVLAEDRVEVDPDIWAQVVGFLERREGFQADYQTFTGKVSGYELHPLHLLAYHGNWYVLAHNPAKGRVETFALSRFRRIDASGRSFERPEGFDAQIHAKEAFGITGGDKVMKVRLLFEPKLAVYISERQWHPSQVLKKRRDGRVELHMETTGRKELVRWVLSWMPDVRVLAPKSLRDRIALKLEEGVRRNRENQNEDMPNQTLHANREQARGR